jgi:hypothetical protein
VRSLCLALMIIVAPLATSSPQPLTRLHARRAIASHAASVLPQRSQALASAGRRLPIAVTASYTGTSRRDEGRDGLYAAAGALLLGLAVTLASRWFLLRIERKQERKDNERPSRFREPL